MANFRLADVKSFRLLTLGALVTILLSIAWRFCYRSDWVPGWDLMGQSQGQFLLETEGFWGLLSRSFKDSRRYQYWTPISSTIYTLIPGYLGRIWPWLHWGAMLNLLVFFCCPWLIIKAAKLKSPETPFLLLLLASSPAFLSYSIANYPYLTGVFPHLISLVIIYSQWFRERPWFGVFTAVLLTEVSIHLYPLGQTFFINFFLFAVLDRTANWRCRIGWLVSALIGYGFTLWAPAQMDIKLAFSLGNLKSFWPVFEKTFIQGLFDHSIVFWLGLISCGFVKRERWPIVLMYLAQWWLILVLASGSLSFLRSRRILVAEVYGIVLFAFAVKDQINYLWRPDEFTKLGRALLGVLFFGVSYQLYDIAKFTSVPILDRNRSLPFVESSADYYIFPRFSQIKNPIIQRVEDGKKILFLYDYLSYAENTTDPRGLLEMLYLELGHKNFSESIHIFSPLKKRYSAVPIQNPSGLANYLQELKTQKSWMNIELWNLRSERSPYALKSHEEVLVEVRKLYKMIPAVSPDKEWEVFNIVPIEN